MLYLQEFLALPKHIGSKLNSTAQWRGKLDLHTSNSAERIMYVHPPENRNISIQIASLYATSRYATSRYAGITVTIFCRSIFRVNVLVIEHTIEVQRSILINYYAVKDCGMNQGTGGASRKERRRRS